MEILRTINEVRNFVAAQPQNIGFVPTMGALHEGHASLISCARAQNSRVLVSTFVNPAQFLAGEDFDKYPKNEAGDAKICQMCGADAMFVPDAAEIYSQIEPLINAPKELASILEGAIRPGHFDGVLRVLLKFFSLIKPARAYFGKKDAQQLAIVQNMVKTMFLGIQIVPCEIVREASGLALSSRNSYLSIDEKKEALKLSRSLFEASNLIKNGEFSSAIIKAKMGEILSPLKVDYVAVVDRNFAPLDKIELGNSIILVAAYVGKTRLIDNLWV